MAEKIKPMMGKMRGRNSAKMGKMGPVTKSKVSKSVMGKGACY